MDPALPATLVELTRHMSSPTVQSSDRVIPSRIKDEGVLSARRATVVEKAGELFMKRGFANVSVNEIADYAGISVGSLYRYVRAKEDLLWLVMDSIYGTLESMLQEKRQSASDPREALRATVGQFFESVAEVRRGILLMYRESHNLPPGGWTEYVAHERRVMAVFSSIIQDGNRDGVFHCDQPDVVALNILLAGHTWSVKRWFIGENVTLSEYADQQIELLLKQVAPWER